MSPEVLFLLYAVQQHWLTEIQAEELWRKRMSDRSGPAIDQIARSQKLLEDWKVLQAREVVGMTLSVETLPHIGEYDVVERLGAGGHGVMFRAQPELSSENVAVKVLAPRLHDDLLYLENFAKQAQAASPYEIENAARTLASGEADGHYFLVSEFIEGESLDARIRRRGALPEAELLHIAQQLTRALAYAREKDLAHRGLRPADVKLTQEGEAMLLDLGLAKEVQDRILLQVAFRLGAEHYFAPEQAEGAEGDARSDVFSLGAILYLAATGTPPLAGDYAAAVASEALEGRVQRRILSPRSLRPELSRGFCAVLTRMMAKRPEDRYANPNTLLADLQSLADGLWPAGADVEPDRTLLEIQPEMAHTRGSGIPPATIEAKESDMEQEEKASVNPEEESVEKEEKLEPKEAEKDETGAKERPEDSKSEEKQEAKAEEEGAEEEDEEDEEEQEQAPEVKADKEEAGEEAEEPEEEKEEVKAEKEEKEPEEAEGKEALEKIEKEAPKAKAAEAKVPPTKRVPAAKERAERAPGERLRPRGAPKKAQSPLLGLLLGPIVLIAILLVWKNMGSAPKNEVPKSPEDGPPTTKIDPNWQKLVDEYKSIQQFITENPEQIEEARERLAAFKDKTKGMPKFPEWIAILKEQLKKLEKNRDDDQKAAIATGAPADNVVMNGSFEEEGDEKPKYWTLEGTNGEWETEAAAEGQRCISVSSPYNRKIFVPRTRGTVWVGTAYPIEPHELYKVKIKTRTDLWRAGVKACVSIGHCVREFEPGMTWREEEFIFMAPNVTVGTAGDQSDGTGDPKRVEIRLGATGGAGEFFFDELQVSKLKPWNKKTRGIELGDGEEIRNNGYTFKMSPDSKTMNYSRCLQDFNATFAQNGTLQGGVVSYQGGWELEPERYVLYAHHVEGFEQTREESPVRLAVKTENYSKDGATFKVEVSNNLADWQTVLTLDKPEGKYKFLAKELFPADTIYVKFSATGPCVLSAYTYQAGLKNKKNPNERIVTFPGKTDFVE